MKFSELKQKLSKMTDDEIADYLDNMQERGKYAKIRLDGIYENLFELDPEDGCVFWTCPNHGECEADLMDLFFGGAVMLKNLEDHGCGFDEDE